MLFHIDYVILKVLYHLNGETLIFDTLIAHFSVVVYDLLAHYGSYSRKLLGYYYYYYYPLKGFQGFEDGVGTFGQLEYRSGKKSHGLKSGECHGHSMSPRNVTILCSANIYIRHNIFVESSRTI